MTLELFMDNNDVVKKKIELEVEVGSTHVERGVNHIKNGFT